MFIFVADLSLLAAAPTPPSHRLMAAIVMYRISTPPLSTILLAINLKKDTKA